MGSGNLISAYLPREKLIQDVFCMFVCTTPSVEKKRKSMEVPKKGRNKIIENMDNCKATRLSPEIFPLLCPLYATLSIS